MQEIDQRREEIRRFIEDCVSASGLKSPTALARAAGFSPSTLNKFLNNPDHPHFPRAETLARIGELSGVEVPRGILVLRVGMGESGDAYDPGEKLTRLEEQLALMMFGHAETMVVRSRALSLEGYLPGDRILVDLDAEAKPGDAVVVNVADSQRGTAETLIRLLEENGLLVPRTTEAGHKTYRCDEGNAPVMGVIVARYRLPKETAA